MYEQRDFPETGRADGRRNRKIPRSYTVIPYGRHLPLLVCPRVARKNDKVEAV